MRVFLVFVAVAACAVADPRIVQLDSGAIAGFVNNVRILVNVCDAQSASRREVACHALACRCREASSACRSPVRPSEPSAGSRPSPRRCVCGVCGVCGCVAVARVWGCLVTVSRACGTAVERCAQRDVDRQLMHAEVGCFHAAFERG
jgi:hypothetical protein